MDMFLPWNVLRERMEEDRCLLPQQSIMGPMPEGQPDVTIIVPALQ